MSTQLATYKTWDVTPNNIRPDVSANLDVDTTNVSPDGVANIVIRQHAEGQHNEFVLSVRVDSDTAYEIIAELKDAIKAAEYAK